MSLQLTQSLNAGIAAFWIIAGGPPLDLLIPRATLQATSIPMAKSMMSRLEINIGMLTDPIISAAARQWPIGTPSRSTSSFQILNQPYVEDATKCAFCRVYIIYETDDRFWVRGSLEKVYVYVPFWYTRIQSVDVWHMWVICANGCCTCWKCISVRETAKCYEHGNAEIGPPLSLLVYGGQFGRSIGWISRW